MIDEEALLVGRRLAIDPQLVLGDELEKKVESLLSKVEVLRESLTNAADKLELADKAYTKSWAIDWNEITQASELSRTILEATK